MRVDRLFAQSVPRRGFHALRDQIDRASAGMVACIAEGAGRRAPADKRYFWSAQLHG